MNSFLIYTVSSALEAAASNYFDEILDQILLSKKCVLLRLLFEGGFYLRAASNTEFTVFLSKNGENFVISTLWQLLHSSVWKTKENYAEFWKVVRRRYKNFVHNFHHTTDTFQCGKRRTLLAFCICETKSLHKYFILFSKTLLSRNFDWVRVNFRTVRYAM